MEKTNLNDYQLRSALYAYWNADINKHIIFEMLEVKKRLMQSFDICVNRCYEVQCCLINIIETL